jgi:DNA-binding GntR family transcriptional regulator
MEQIVEDMADRIATGEYQPGDQLPSYRELAVDYNVSHTTIATAIRILRWRGLVVGVPGRGTFVAED